MATRYYCKLVHAVDQCVVSQSSGLNHTKIAEKAEKLAAEIAGTPYIVEVWRKTVGKGFRQSLLHTLYG